MHSASETAAANARIKGEFVRKMTDLPVLAFDTVVGIDGVVFGKPRDRGQAVDMFKTLCGATHEVVTAVYFAIKDKIIEKSEKT